MLFRYGRWLILFSVLLSWCLPVSAASSMDVSKLKDKGDRSVEVKAKNRKPVPYKQTPVAATYQRERSSAWPANYSRKKSGYVGLALGGVSLKVKKKPELYESKVKKKFALGFFGGYHFNKYYTLGLSMYSLGQIDQIYDIEGENAWHGPADLTTVEVDNYFTYPILQGRLVPFLGLGLGVFRISGEGKKAEGDKKVYKYRSSSSTWQIMGGVDYGIVPSFDLGLELRHSRPTAKFSSRFTDGHKVKTTVNITSIVLAGKINFR